jgi:hypothetical protein
MHALAILLFVASQQRITIVDTVHSRLSRIIESTIAEELRTRSIPVGPDGSFLAEIVDTSDASGGGRTSQIAVSPTRSVQVTEVVGGAAAEVQLYNAAHELVATYRLSGSGSSSASVGAKRGDAVTAFIIAPFFRRSRSAEAARAIGHDIGVSIASAVSKQTPR